MSLAEGFPRNRLTVNSLLSEIKESGEQPYLPGVDLSKNSEVRILAKQRYTNKLKEETHKSQLARADLDARRDRYQQRKQWSQTLLSMILIMVAFQFILLSLVGAKVWDFTDYKYLLEVLLFQNLAQIVGLAVYAVRFLFSDSDTRYRAAEKKYKRKFKKKYREKLKSKQKS